MKNSLVAVATAPAQTIKLDTLSVSDLKKIASEKKLKFTDKIKKSQLIELIQTGTFTPTTVVEVSKEVVTKTFQIGNGSKFSAPSKTSIANIRFLVRNYMLRNNIEKAKDVQITLPNGTVLQADKINTLKQYIVNEFQGIYAGRGVNTMYDSQIKFLNTVATEANKLIIEWDNLGTTDDKLSKKMLLDAATQLVNGGKIEANFAQNVLTLID